MPNRGRKVRRHTIHYYLALAGIATAVVVCALGLWAYYNEGLIWTRVAFIALLAGTGILFATWFWGVYLLMSGRIPRYRLPVLLFHAAVGSIAPLLYLVCIGAQMQTAASQPVGDVQVEVAIATVPVLLIQLFSGWTMLRRRPG